MEIIAWLDDHSRYAACTRTQPAQPTTVAELQALLDRFATEYNTTRPHRSLPHRSTPATAYADGA